MVGEGEGGRQELVEPLKSMAESGAAAAEENLIKEQIPPSLSSTGALLTKLNTAPY